MDIIFFCGIKHSGKTSLAKLVAKIMHYACIDNDDLILADRPEFSTIRELYKAEGKEAFMAQETSSLKAFLDQKPSKTIISLGGGACDNDRLWPHIGSSGRVVYLKVAQDVLLKRILSGGVPPFLDPLNVERSFAELYAHRDELYGKLSHIVVELPPYADINDTAEFLFSRLSEELMHGSQ